MWIDRIRKIIFLLLTILLRETSSAKSEFLASPSNSTTIVGGEVILRCKIRDSVHTCQWFHLGAQSDATHNKPMLIKEFAPSANGDCSIKFSHAIQRQTGHWVCKALSKSDNRYVISEPAFVNVLLENEYPIGKGDREPDHVPEVEEIHPTEPPTNSKFPFISTEGMHIVNAHIGETTALRCLTQSPIQTCHWIEPRGTKLIIYNSEETRQPYELKLNKTARECLLMVKEVKATDEGNWRCTVTLKDSVGEFMGPMTHLHVLDLGIDPHNFHHGNPNNDDFGIFGSKKNSSLIVILVTTSLILLLIVIALVVFLVQRKAWRSRPEHKYLGRDTTSQYSGYAQWLPDINGPKDPGLLSETSSNHYGGAGGGPPNHTYLDMSCRSSAREFPHPFQDRSLNSASSIRTLGPAPSLPFAGAEGVADLRKNKSEINVASSTTFGNPTFEGRSGGQRTPPSDCSNSHLYEDIDKFAKSRLHPDEDTEGYMVPNRRDRMPTPPLDPAGNSYSNVNEVSDQRDSGFGLSESMEEQTAVPPPSPPARNDSTMNNPLANYDVPKKSMESLNG